MQFRTDEEVLQECIKIGDAGVEARLAEGLFSDNPTPAREWLNQRRMQREMKNTRWALYASWVLVIITFTGIWFQKQDAHEQREDAKALLEVQISSELDKRFDSIEMRKARGRLANQLLKNIELTEFRVIDFFDSLAMYTHRDRIDHEIVYQSYSYWVKRYWPAIKTHIEAFRKEQNDPSYYKDVEDLYSEMLADDAKDGVAVPNEKEIQRFLKEEATLPL